MKLQQISSIHLMIKAASIINVHLILLKTYIEQVKENKKLYEALLKSEREKISLIEKMLHRE